MNDKTSRPAADGAVLSTLLTEAHGTLPAHAAHGTMPSTPTQALPLSWGWIVQPEGEALGS